jgi:hypothetical protein
MARLHLAHLKPCGILPGWLGGEGVVGGCPPAHRATCCRPVTARRHMWLPTPPPAPKDAGKPRIPDEEKYVRNQLQFCKSLKVTGPGCGRVGLVSFGRGGARARADTLEQAASASGAGPMPGGDVARQGMLLRDAGASGAAGYAVDTLQARGLVEGVMVVVVVGWWWGDLPAQSLLLQMTTTTVPLCCPVPLSAPPPLCPLCMPPMGWRAWPVCRSLATWRPPTARTSGPPRPPRRPSPPPRLCALSASCARACSTLCARGRLLTRTCWARSRHRWAGAATRRACWRLASM